MTRRLRAPLFALAVSLVTLVAVVVYTTHTQTQSTAQNCQQIELLKKSIRGSLDRALKLLGQKGGAGYQYYQAHPEELASARREIAVELYEFRTVAC